MIPVKATSWNRETISLPSGTINGCLIEALVSRTFVRVPAAERKASQFYSRKASIMG